VGGGVEAMAAELAERRGIPVAQARTLLYEVDLAAEPDPAISLPPEAQAPLAPQPAEPEPGEDEPASLSREDHEARETEMGYAEAMEAARPPVPAIAPEPELEQQPEFEVDVRAVLERGIREISSEVRNSLDFYRSQEQGGHISHVVLSGAALDLRGFAPALEQSLGFEVRPDAVGVADRTLEGSVSTNRLSIATGLACTEAPR
jgi:Tfp pilus assembly PilM family ATPase